MRIGMKYCGGCRPPAKDIAGFEKLMKYLMAQGAALATTRQEYDYLFLLCGCSAKCTSVDGCHFRKKLFKVDRSITENEVLRIIEEVENERRLM